MKKEEYVELLGDFVALAPHSRFTPGVNIFSITAASDALQIAEFMGLETEANRVLFVIDNPSDVSKIKVQYKELQKRIAEHRAACKKANVSYG